MFLADLVRHIGNAWAEERGVPASDTVAAVMAALGSELEQPTTGVVGEFHPGHA